GRSVGYRGPHSSEPRRRVPDGHFGRVADRRADGGGDDSGLRCRHRRYRMGSLPQDIVTAWSAGSIATGTGARRSGYCSSANLTPVGGEYSTRVDIPSRWATARQTALTP